MRMQNLTRLVAMVVVAGATVPVLADGADIDIGALESGGRMVSWAANHTDGVYLAPERVFKGQLNLIDGVVEGDEPGFYFRGDNPFQGFRTGFNVRAAARVWNPAGSNDAPGTNFTAIAGVSFTFGDAIFGTVTTPTSDPLSPIAGPSILLGGEVDFHYPILMNGNTQGIYLIELEQYTTKPGVANSEPLWVILGYGADEASLDAAKEYVEAFVVPAPGVGAMLGIVGVMASRRRRNA